MDTGKDRKYEKEGFKSPQMQKYPLAERIVYPALVLEYENSERDIAKVVAKKNDKTQLWWNCHLIK